MRQSTTAILAQIILGVVALAAIGGIVVLLLRLLSPPPPPEPRACGLATTFAPLNETDDYQAAVRALDAFAEPYGKGRLGRALATRNAFYLDEGSEGSLAWQKPDGYGYCSGVDSDSARIVARGQFGTEPLKATDCQALQQIDAAGSQLAQRDRALNRRDPTQPVHAPGDLICGCAPGYHWPSNLSAFTCTKGGAFNCDIEGRRPDNDVEQSRFVNDEREYSQCSCIGAARRAGQGLPAPAGTRPRRASPLKVRASLL